MLLKIIADGGKSMHCFATLVQSTPPLLFSISCKSCLLEFWHSLKCEQAELGKRLHIFGILALAEIVSALSLVVVLKQEECECGIWDRLRNTLVWISSFIRECLIPHINMLVYLAKSEVTLISYTAEAKVCTSAWIGHLIAGIMANVARVTFHFKCLYTHITDTTAGRVFYLFLFCFK